MSEADAMGLPEEALPPIKEHDCFFWMVWCDGGRAPTAVHITEERAIREARRLARKVLGKRFYVLKGYRSFKCRGEPRPEGWVGGTGTEQVVMPDPEETP